MAGFLNSCYKCGASVEGEFYSAFQLSKVCAACLRIEQQNKAMREALEEDRRERAYRERSYEPSTPSEPLPPEIQKLAPFQQILWASGEKNYKMGFMEVMFRGFFEMIQPGLYVVAVIAIILFLNKVFG